MIKDDESKNLSNRESFSPFAHWVIQNRKVLVLATSILFVAAICFAIFRHKSTLRYFQNIQQAELLAENVAQINPKESAEKSSLALLAICNQQPDIQSRYAGILAQELIIQGKPCDPYAEESILSLKSNDLSLFAQFSEVTLLSEKEQFSHALLKAQDLLEKSSHFTLRACTLLQIAALQKVMNQVDNCKKTIEELQLLLKSDPQGEKFSSLFQKQNISLLDFLNS